MKCSMFMYNKLLYLEDNINNTSNLFKESKIISEKSSPKCCYVQVIVYRLKKNNCVDMFKTCFKTLEVPLIKRSADILVAPFYRWMIQQFLLLAPNVVNVYDAIFSNLFMFKNVRYSPFYKRV